jgi:hypothetical protein
MLRRQFLSSPITGSPASMAVPRVRGIIPNWRILVLEPNGCRDRLTRTLTRIPTRTLTLPQNRTLNPDSGFGCGIASARSRSAEKRAKCTANVPIRAPFLRIRCCLSASYWNNINPPPGFCCFGPVLPSSGTRFSSCNCVGLVAFRFGQALQYCSSTRLHQSNELFTLNGRIQ